MIQTPKASASVRGAGERRRSIEKKRETGTTVDAEGTEIVMMMKVTMTETDVPDIDALVEVMPAVKKTTGEGDETTTNAKAAPAAVQCRPRNLLLKKTSGSRRP